jgi:hypothetical protein
MIISIDKEKTFDKIAPHAKSPGESWDRRIISQHKKVIYNKPKANITMNGEKLKGFPVKYVYRPFSTFLFITALEFLDRLIKQGKK